MVAGREPAADNADVLNGGFGRHTGWQLGADTLTGGARRDRFDFYCAGRRSEKTPLPISTLAILVVPSTIPSGLHGAGRRGVRISGLPFTGAGAQPLRTSTAPGHGDHWRAVELAASIFDTGRRQHLVQPDFRRRARTVQPVVLFASVDSGLRRRCRQRLRADLNRRKKGDRKCAGPTGPAPSVTS